MTLQWSDAIFSIINHDYSNKYQELVHPSSGLLSHWLMVRVHTGVLENNTILLSKKPSASVGGFLFQF